MKRFVILLSLLLGSANAVAGSHNIHSWLVGTSANWRTFINLTNSCNQDDVQVTVKFWTSDGAVLTNKAVSSTETTDANGEISFTLTPRESKLLSMDYRYFSAYTHGSARVSTSYTEPGTRCLVGGYYSNTTTALSNSYIMNNGKRF